MRHARMDRLVQQSATVGAHRQLNQLRPKCQTTPCSTRQVWPRNLNQTISGNPGEVHCYPRNSTTPNFHITAQSSTGNISMNSNDAPLLAVMAVRSAMIGPGWVLQAETSSSTTVIHSTKSDTDWTCTLERSSCGPIHTASFVESATR